MEVAERFHAAHEGLEVKTKIGDAWRLTAADLVLANAVNQPFGWASKHNLSLIEPWRHIDVQSWFLLIYSSPAHTLAEAAEIGAVAADDIATLLIDWKDYHTNMLRLHREIGGRSILLDADYFSNHPTKVAHLLADRFDLPIGDTPVTLTDFREASPVFSALLQSLIVEDEELATLLNKLNAAADVKLQTSPTNAMASTISAISELSSFKNSTETSKGETEKIHGNYESTEQVKAIEQENQILRRQLQKAREELQGSFGNAKISRPDRKEKRTTNNASETPDHYFDMCDIVQGENWLPAGPEGRWAGPHTVSTLNLRQIPEGKYDIVIDVLSAMADDIFEEMTIKANGKLLQLSRNSAPNIRGGLLSWSRKMARRSITFPATLKGTLSIDKEDAAKGLTLTLTFPRTIAPTNNSAASAQKLAVRFSSISLIAKH